ITEEQAREKMKAVKNAELKANAASTEAGLTSLAERLKEQVAEGVITAEQAKATLAAVAAEREAGKAGPTPADCEKMKAEAAAALRSGSPNAPAAAEKIRTVCGG